MMDNQPSNSNNMQGFKKASNALSAYGKEQRDAAAAKKRQEVETNYDGSYVSGYNKHESSAKAERKKEGAGLGFDDGFENDRVMAMKELLRRDNIPEGEGGATTYQSPNMRSVKGTSGGMIRGQTLRQDEVTISAPISYNAQVNPTGM